MQGIFHVHETYVSMYTRMYIDAILLNLDPDINRAVQFRNYSQPIMAEAK